MKVQTLYFLLIKAGKKSRKRAKKMQKKAKKKATFVAQIAQSILELTDVDNRLSNLIGGLDGFRVRLIISLRNN